MGASGDEKGKPEKAIADFDAAIGLDPQSAETHRMRGLAWKEKGDFDQAIADFDAVIRLEPKDTQCYLMRGLAWEEKGDFDQAIASYDAAIRLEPRDAEAHLMRGLAWKEKGDFDKALADANEAIRLEPSNPEAHNDGAWILATCPDVRYRDGKRAVASATRACELSDWKKANPLDTLAAACAEAGEFEAAVKWQQSALKLTTDAKDQEQGRGRLALYTARSALSRGDAGTVTEFRACVRVAAPSSARYNGGSTSHKTRTNGLRRGPSGGFRIRSCTLTS